MPALVFLAVVFLLQSAARRDPIAQQPVTVEFVPADEPLWS